MNHKARDSKAGHKNWVPNITVFTGKLVTTQGVKITQAEGLFLNRGDEDVIKIKKKINWLSMPSRTYLSLCT